MNPETEWTEPLENEETTGFDFYSMDFEPETTESSESEAGTSATIYEDLSGVDPEATEEVTVITMEDLQSIGSDIVHADLFGSFLICGTLIALFLFRGMYGT